MNTLGARKNKTIFGEDRFIRETQSPGNSRRKKGEEYSQRLKVINYFLQKTASQMFYWVLNTPPLIVLVVW